MLRLRVILDKLRQFRDDAAAVAAIEFALVLPLLAALYLGTIEAATFYSADQKVATIASTMASIARTRNGAERLLSSGAVMSRPLTRVSTSTKTTSRDGDAR